jgi:hypothetical protein
MAAINVDVPPRPALSMWYAILGAPAAWAAQETTGWLLAEWVCRGTGAGGEQGHADLMRWTGLGVSVAALAIALGALAIGVRAWRTSADRRLSAIHGRARPDFLAATALLVSFVFTLAIVLAGLPLIMLPVCEAVR